MINQVRRPSLALSRRVVIKVGSALLSRSAGGLATDRIDSICSQINRLLTEGVQVALVSSGAVAAGMGRLGISTRPTELHQLQAAAAVGQMGLVEAYERAFSFHERKTAMILLTHEDLADRHRYLNARTTLTRLLDMGVVPVINENDTVATEEIRFGDNDTLASLVVNLLQADLMIILTDTDGLHEEDPKLNPSAALVEIAQVTDQVLDGMARSSAGELGRGGMHTKLEAARRAARSGANTLIANGEEEHVLTRAISDENIGTLLVASVTPMAARKGWIAGQLKPQGDLYLDAGATLMIRDKGVSLLPVGVTRVVGSFSRGDVVRCLDSKGHIFAQGLVNYDSHEIEKLMGAATEEIFSLLGYAAEPELIHRDNLALFD
tara:strand:+ start:771 stop:1907 length:1137 start_codon:yes stop_codon:yes gene_type:complete